MTVPLIVGDRVNFAEERNCYTAQAISDDGRWVICTKPFPPQRTVMYTIVDTVNQVRGTDNLVFSFGYETREQCEYSLGLLVSGDMELSHRRRPIPLVITRVQPAREVSDGE